MKKNLLAILSVCTFLTALTTANAQETNAGAEKKHSKKSEKTSEIDNKEKALRAEIEKNTSCQTILGECKKLGFVAGGFKEGNGLWRNCFGPVVAGKSASLKGKEVSIAANANDVSACKVTVQEVRKEKKALKKEAKKEMSGKAHSGEMKAESATAAAKE